MKENWENAFLAVLKHEGGYVNHPRDPGGMTNLGVTKRAWEAYVGHEVDEAAMRALTPDVVKPFYKKMYWDKIKGDDLPPGVDYAAYDCGMRWDFLKRLPTWDTFGKGWGKRVADVEEKAAAMAKSA